MLGEDSGRQIIRYNEITNDHLQILINIEYDKGKAVYMYNANEIG